jgi:hypothetical protein
LIATPTATRGTTADGGANPEIQELLMFRLDAPANSYWRGGELMIQIAPHCFVNEPAAIRLGLAAARVAPDVR